jgi:hypothetical protein
MCAVIESFFASFVRYCISSRCSFRLLLLFDMLIYSTLLKFHPQSPFFCHTSYFLPFSRQVGRFAVTQGTKRDIKGVEQCLEVNLAILRVCTTLPLPGGLNKNKLGPLKGSCDKLQNMLLELSLASFGKSPLVGVEKIEEQKESAGRDDE